MRIKVTNEKKNLTRLAGEFLVASRLTQRGYMVSLQWGATIGYDILAFDKRGNVAFIEVKSTASHPKKWVLQKKYAHPEKSQISITQRFVCCVDLTSKTSEPCIYIFPAAVVADGLKYCYAKGFSKSNSYAFPLNKKPRGVSDQKHIKSVGEYINADSYKENYKIINVTPIID